MASDDKKAKPAPAPKKEAAPADNSAAAPAPSKAADTATAKAADATPAKADGGEKPTAAPASYSRGEGQKPVTQAYKDNWNAIFAAKKAKKKKR